MADRMSTTTPLAVSLADALAAGPVVLDGGLSTELEARGHDVSSALWSARLLLDDPGAVVAAHAAFAAAGARVATTASYQATLPGLAAAGISRTAAERLITSSVALAREGGHDGHDGGGGSWVAGAVGPYGAHLADGSEYTGAYLDVLAGAQLRAFHRPHLQLLAQAGADVLACETLPGAAEVDALLTELDALGAPAWVGLSAVVDGEGVVRTRRGERADAVLAAAASVPCVIAVGVNCTDPAAVLPAARQARTALAGSPGSPGSPASSAALVAYPNSGEGWDAAARAWRPSSPGEHGGVAALVPGWLEAGVALVGGCCRVGPEQVRAIASAVSGAVSAVRGRG